MIFREWLREICEGESPDRDIIAFNFGLFETEDGFTVYLVGSKEYDPDDPDWATNKDFEPALKYYPLPSEESKKQTWNEVLEEVRSRLIEFSVTETFRKSFLARASVITTGFDDGELVPIYIAKDDSHLVQ